MLDLEVLRRASRCFTLGMIAIGVGASTSSAQVLAVFLNGEKAAKKFEDRVVLVNGRPAVLGEAKSGITVNGNSISRDPKVMLELWVADPDDPSVEAYGADKKGEREAASKKTVLRLDNSHIPEKDYATIVMRNESLPSLSREYGLRQELIASYRADRDEFDRTTTEWAAHHLRVVTAMEGLQTWLSNTLWPKYAERYGKEIAKEAKAHKGAAVRMRHDKALASLQTTEVPARLEELSQELSSGRDRFQVRETQHMRVYFVDALPPASVERALLLGEEAIEGFRTQFVDPYLADDYADNIPDDVFLEFLFVPEDTESYTGYTNGFWGIDWTRDRERRLESTGGRVDGSKRNKYKSYWKLVGNQDIDGIICHQLGHALAGFHYGPNGRIEQDWLSEALGYHLSFEFLGRNTVTCKAIEPERSGYVKPDRKASEGEKTVGEGRRDLYNAIALELGRPIEALARKPLYELDDADLAKSWSFYDYLARAEGKPGQLWLRSAGKHAHDEKNFIANWRSDAAKILGVAEGEAFRAIDARWRAFAQSSGAEGSK